MTHRVIFPFSTGFAEDQQPILFEEGNDQLKQPVNPQVATLSSSSFAVLTWGLQQLESLRLSLSGHINKVNIVRNTINNGSHGMLNAPLNQSNSNKPMINAVTPETLYLILPYKVSQLAVRLAEHFGWSAAEAVEKIYESNTYRSLEDEGTKLWHYGPVALKEHFLENN